jgi:phosphoribosyl 1,2-cyclic phosphate phosphodiesterase
MLRERVKRIDAILFTHAHRDHTAGLDDVRAYNFIQRMDMPIYGRQEVLDNLKIEYSYAFGKESYPGTPRLLLNLIDSKPFSIDGVDIIPLEVLHLKMPVLGFRFGNFSYITDANFIPDRTIEKLKGTEVLVLNALQREPHISHFNLEEALAMIERIKPGCTYLTHVSHNLGLHADVAKELPENVMLSYDGMQLDVGE